MKRYYMYILANEHRRLYVGVTNNLMRRMFEHRKRSVPGFTQKYYLTRLVYFEETDEVAAAIAREKQIKGWLRKRKIALIESVNPEWLDLAGEWFDTGADPSLRSG
ncbi:MAG: GIY-YIG nuclease family protein [SAR202 cluster bacterium]|nr:GIY-YIG nuclease family protein [SAR202 cluster bacterium]